MRGRRWWPCILGAVVLSVPGMPVEGRGGTVALVVRWEPSADASVVGYRIYKRHPNGRFARAMDAGMPRSAADGTLSTILRGLDRKRAYAVAVSAYDRSGAESELSNELGWRSRSHPCVHDADCADDDACTQNERCRRGRCVQDPVVCVAPGPCEPAACDPQAGCQTTRIPDGGTCHDGDPCIDGACAGTACVIPTTRHAANDDLAISRFSVRRIARRRHRIRARGSFVVPGTADPHATGATVALHDPWGATLYQATIPGDAFRSHGGRRFTLRVGRRGARGAYGAGLRHLDLTLDGDHAVWATVDAVTADLLPDTAPAALVWVVRLGDTCVRATGIGCDAGVCR